MPTEKKIKEEWVNDFVYTIDPKTRMFIKVPVKYLKPLNSTK